MSDIIDVSTDETVGSITIDVDDGSIAIITGLDDLQAVLMWATTHQLPFRQGMTTKTGVSYSYTKLLSVGDENYIKALDEFLHDYGYMLSDQ